MSDNFEFRGFQVPIHLALLTGSGPDDFKTISDWHQDLLRAHIDLKSSDNVVEIGCGIGRDAIPLASVITSGSYIGTDIIGESIDWCTNNITPRNPRLKFVHFDVSDGLHNRTGSMANNQVVLPAADNSIDKIFLFSVFTHMMKDDIRHYLREIYRILRPDGLVYATTFIYDDEILASARRTNLTPFDLRFEHEHGEGCRINSLEAPLGAVAYTKEMWDEMISGTGLVYASDTLTGAWSGFYSNPQEGQDVMLLKRQT